MCEFHFFRLKIYEGNNVNAPKVGRWCGTRLPPEYSSLSNEILVVFRTDFSSNGVGFRLKYETRAFSIFFSLSIIVYMYILIQTKFPIFEFSLWWTVRR